MNATIAIAQVLGIVLTVMGLAAVINKKSIAAAVEEVAQKPGFMWLWGFLILTMGAVLIALNNVWSHGLQLLITVLGWLTVIKGAYIILLPDSASSLYRKVSGDTAFTIGGIVAFIVGLVLLYKGFYIG